MWFVIIVICILVTPLFVVTIASVSVCLAILFAPKRRRNDGRVAERLNASVLKTDDLV
jgi:hypothetical protein